jgi:group I intron endonuclease
MIGIYQITSLIDNKIYIGSSVNIKQRWKRHLSQLRNSKHSNILLQRIYDKYGETNLQFSILLQCDKECIREKEQYFLDANPNSLNINKHASGGDIISNHPYREEIRQRQINETRKAALKEDLRQKRRENGKRLYPNGLITHHSDETKRKMRESRGFKIKIDDQIYNSAREAAEKLNSNHKSILLKCSSPKFPNYQLLKT